MTIDSLATGTVRSARTIEKWTFFEPRSTVSATCVPALPWISLEPKEAGRLASEVEPTATITSARWMPAFAAGEPGNTSTTCSPRGCTTTSIPIPLRCGLVSFMNALYEVGS